MMSIWFFSVFIVFFLVMESSFHLLVFLLIVEFLVLMCFVFLLINKFSLISGIFFLLVGVCVGAYSICLYVSLIRSKVSSYLMSFFYF